MSGFLVQGGAPPDDSVTTVMVKDDVKMIIAAVKADNPKPEE